jgi:hypothetical protein
MSTSIFYKLKTLGSQSIQDGKKMNPGDSIGCLAD